MIERSLAQECGERKGTGATFAVSAWPVPLSPLGFSASNPVTGALAQARQSLGEDIPLGVWGRCFGKVGGGLATWWVLAGGIVGQGHIVSQPLLSQSPVFVLQ